MLDATSTVTASSSSLSASKRERALQSKRHSHLDKRHKVALLQVDWKLKRGKFRPRMQALVGSNTAEAVQTATTAAFAALQDAAELSAPSDTDIKKALQHLTSLKVLL